MIITSVFSRANTCREKSRNKHRMTASILSFPRFILFPPDDAQSWLKVGGDSSRILLPRSLRDNLRKRVITTVSDVKSAGETPHSSLGHMPLASRRRSWLRCNLLYRVSHRVFGGALAGMFLRGSSPLYH